MSHTPPGRTRERVFRFVRDRLLAGEPPTVREVQGEFGFRAVESARAHLEALVQEGRLAKSPGAARGYRLAAAARRGALRFVPVLGRVQAGALAEAVEEATGEATDVVAVQTRVPPEDLFALRVRGDSMRDAGILDGDLVVVRRQGAAEDGAVVVALVGSGDGSGDGAEATVKRLRRVRLPGGGTRIELHPANPDFEVIVPEAGAVTVLGRVIEVRRMLDAELGPASSGSRPARTSSPAPRSGPAPQGSGAAAMRKGR